MEGRFPSAIRCVFTDCSDRSSLSEFNDWYDRVHVPDMLASGLVNTAVRYENGEPSPGVAEFLAIYEFDHTDLERVADAMAAHVRWLASQGRMHAALRVVDRRMWRRVGGEFRNPRSTATTPRGIFLVESNCTESERESEFNSWYDLVHIPDLLATGLFATAYRFEAASPNSQGKYLAIYETLEDPVEAVDEFVRSHRPRLKAAGRLSEIIDVTWRGVFRRI